MLDLAVIAACRWRSLRRSPPAHQWPLHAQGKLDARYTWRLAGIPIGKGSWAIDIDGHSLSPRPRAASTTGLLRVFASGQGTSFAHGTLRAGSRSCPRSMRPPSPPTRSPTEVRIRFSNGNVKEFLLDPPHVADPDRVPLTEASTSRRARSDDRLADARSRAPATRSAGGLPAHAADFRRPHALRPAACLQAHGPGQVRQGL